MAGVVSTPMTRRSVVAGLTLTAAPVAISAGADSVYAQAKQTAPEKSLYERLGGVFAIAAVVDHFSDAVVKNPVVGQKSKNPQLREWHTKNLRRLPGLKFMRTLWVCCREGPSNSRQPGLAPRCSASRRRTDPSASRPQNSMRLRRNSDGPWISPRSPSARRPKSWQPSPLTRLRSPPVIPRPASVVEPPRRFGVLRAEEVGGARTLHVLVWEQAADAPFAPVTLSLEWTVVTSRTLIRKMRGDGAVPDQNESGCGAPH
jgi:hypothetical protein